MIEPDSLAGASARGSGPPISAPDRHAVDAQTLAPAVVRLDQHADDVAAVSPSAREAVPMPPLNSWQIMPVPPPTFPSATAPPCAAVERGVDVLCRTCWPSDVVEEAVEGLADDGQRPGASLGRARGGSASRTTPTLNVFVMPIGVVSRPDSRTHSSPVSSPLPLSRWQPAKSGVSGGTTIVTPVRTSSPSIRVV